MIRFFILLYIAMLTCGMRAAGVGTWRLFLSYSNIEQIEVSGTDVYVKASGNLYSYHLSDGTVQTHDKTNGLTNSDITHIAWVPSAKKLLVIYSDYLFDLLDANGNVTSMTALRDYSTNKSKTVREVRTSGRYAYVITAVGTMKIDARNEYVVETYKEGTTVPDLPAAVTKEQGPNGSLTYDSTNRCYWGANAEGKLTKYAKAEDGTFTAQTSGVGLEGPKYKEHNWLKLYNGKLYSLRGMYEGGNSDTEIPGDVQVLNIADGMWSVYDNSYAEQTGKRCIAHIALDVDPIDNGHVAVASKSGLYEYKDGKMVAYYDMDTSDPILSPVNLPHYSVITGLKYDGKGNLWLFNMGQGAVLCLTADGQWKKYAHDELLNQDKIRLKNWFFDANGMLWFCNDWNLVMTGFYNPSTDELHYISDYINEDGTNVAAYSTGFAEDKEGNLWIGTRQNGPIYLSSDDISKMRSQAGKNELNVVQHKVARNDNSGLADYLLSSVDVYDIKVDAANRKWFATNSGVFLISSDNNEQVYNFTKDNSPLPNNTVKSIALDETSGTVYFGTLEGLCSYQSDVTGTYGDMSNDNAYAYPNPVQPDYTGMITIVGLTDHAQLKITTPSGYVVHTGVVSGASYQWDGRDQTGKRVASGVYSVLVADQYGESGLVTKIAMVR